jgi:hypothetical protein
MQWIKLPPAYGQRSAEDRTKPPREAKKRSQVRVVETPPLDETAAAKLVRARAEIERANRLLRTERSERAKLERENAELRARLDQPDDFVPLKTAIPAGFTYETIRSWAHAGLIASRREGGRISIGLRSLNERLARLNRRS